VGVGLLFDFFFRQKKEDALVDMASEHFTKIIKAISKKEEEQKEEMLKRFIPSMLPPPPTPAPSMVSESAESAEEDDETGGGTESDESAKDKIVFRHLTLINLTISEPSVPHGGVMGTGKEEDDEHIWDDMPELEDAAPPLAQEPAASPPSPRGESVYQDQPTQPRTQDARFCWHTFDDPPVSTPWRASEWSVTIAPYPGSRPQRRAETSVASVVGLELPFTATELQSLFLARAMSWQNTVYVPENGSLQWTNPQVMADPAASPIAAAQQNPEDDPMDLEMPDEDYIRVKIPNPS
jgi:hypothetical protein